MADVPPFLDPAGPDLARWFDMPDRAAWEAAATRLLKGRPLASLTQALPEGLNVPPLHGPAPARDDLGMADAPPYRRGAGVADRRQAGWDVRVSVDAGNLVQARDQVRAAVAGGARSVWLTPDDVGRGLRRGQGVPLRCDGCLTTVLDDVDPTTTPVHVTPGARAGHWVGHLRAWGETRGVTGAALTGAVPDDPCGDAVAGHDVDLDARFDALDAVIRAAADLPSLHLVGVSTLPWVSRGAQPVAELVGVLATGATVLRALTERGLDVGDVAPRVLLTVAAGRDTFLEIAKLRAVRVLWSALVRAFGGDAAARRAFVHAVTSPTLVATRDPWVNLLRQSHGAFCAAVAGADAITMLSWDRGLGVPDAHAQRIACTSQAVLEAEAHLARVGDPAGGSWYVESLTDTLIARAWTAFQQVEGRGGLPADLASGALDALLAEGAGEVFGRVASRSWPVVGVSVHPNPEEDRPERPEAALGVVMREAAPWEALRDRADRLPTRPRAFLATMGPLARHEPRADFVRQLCHAIGFGVVQDEGRDTPEGLASAFAASGAAVAFLCGHDDDYPDRVPAFAQALRDAGALSVVLAGKPGANAEAWRDAGVDEAVYWGADVLALGRRLHDQVGGGL